MIYNVYQGGDSMSVSVTISKWGNSLGLRIPNVYAKELNLIDGDTVDLSVSEQTLSVSKHEISKARQIIEQFYGMPYEQACVAAKSQPPEEELDWGCDVGDEVFL
jgi:antitoxin MazE